MTMAKWCMLVLTLAACLALAGCSDDDDNVYVITRSGIFLSFVAGDQPYDMSYLTLYHESESRMSISAGSSSTGDLREILTLIVPEAAGLYFAGQGSIAFLPHGDSSTDRIRYYAASGLSQTNLRIEILGYDAESGTVEGLFSGRLQLMEGDGEEFITISAGEFRGTF